MFDHPMNAIREMTAAYLRIEQLRTTVSPAILIPDKANELVITFIQIKKRNNGRTAAFRWMDEEGGK
ncbi:hypothetical protein [Paraburkholderia sp. UCT2]|uniref:hypothetical protein n=1 Tax=Paraburkholderia sp. UCT2 TaxID=2615208 RepID=UPI00223C2CF0|nr:hypothetical protein [Paraburkholderia sp. UCT2]